MQPNRDNFSRFGFGREASVVWSADDWDRWREEVERRIIALEYEVAAYRKTTFAEALDSLATNAEALDSLATNGDGEQQDVNLTVDLSPALVQGDDGTITVSLTPATGGVFGAAPDNTDGPDYTDEDAAEDDAAVAAQQAPVNIKRVRAPRVSPTDAKLRVQQALTSAQSTIRGVTAWEAANGWNNPLTTSQVRTALTSLEQEGKVYVAGKRGKQEVWSIRS